MASKRRRKRPLPDWVGESYSSATKQAEEEDDKAVEAASTARLKDLSVPQQNVNGSQYSTHTYSKLTEKKKDEKASSKEETSYEEVLRMSLPLLMFEGSLIYSHNHAECSMLCEELMSSAVSGHDLLHVGLDMEWPVTYQSSGATKKVALIQLCTGEDKCYLFHLAAIGGLPKALKTLLSHSQIIKYGINIEADFWKLARDFDIQVRDVIRDSVMDLSKLANAKLKSTERWTLDGLSRNVLRRRLDKDESVRCGRWDDYPLSEQQLEYAAADAYASFKLAAQLRGR